MHKTQVLLADDHAIIRDGLKQILSDTDDLVVSGEAANGNELMHLVRERNWGVLVLDIETDLTHTYSEHASRRAVRGPCHSCRRFRVSDQGK